MPITLGNNIQSLRGLRHLDSATSSLSKTFERLSSGVRINRASDDAAGLAIATVLSVTTRVHSQAIKNINDGISLLSITEGAITTMQDIVSRIQELSEQGANGTLTPRQRVALDKEADALVNEYNRIIRGTTFNGVGVIDGREDSISLQHGFGTRESTFVAMGNELGVAAGDGSFRTISSFSASNELGDLVATDVNGDGITDLVATDYEGWMRLSGNSTVSVLIGNGNGTFKARVSYEAGTVGSITVADVDGDGKVDLLGASSTGLLQVLKGNGDGTYLAARSYGTSYGSPQGVDVITVADYNNDGATDVVITQTGGGPLAFLLLGNGNGTFKSSITVNLGVVSEGIATSDFNRDGIPDLISHGEIMGVGISVLLGNGDGTFRRVFSTNDSIFSIKTADLNGDGYNDIIATHDETFIYLGNGDGSFSAKRTFGGYGVSNLVEDFNGDGILDISTLHHDPGESFSILIGNGDGSFQRAITYAHGMTGGLSIPFVAADFNRDGVTDLSVGSNEDGKIGLYFGNQDSSGRRNNFIYALDLSTRDGSRSALTWAKIQSEKLSKELGMIGAYQSRINSSLSVIDATKTHTTIAYARIMDADVAQETGSATRFQILKEAATAMLAQANLQPQMALRLISE